MANVVSPELIQQIIPLAVPTIVSSVAILIGWLASQVFNSNKKEMNTIAKNQKEHEKTTNDRLRTIELSLEGIKGQLAIALNQENHIERIKEQINHQGSQLSAVWKIIDHKRASDV